MIKKYINIMHCSERVMDNGFIENTYIQMEDAMKHKMRLQS